jgi:hypothetical protein
MTKWKDPGNKEWKRLRERIDALQRVSIGYLDDREVANDHLKFVIADWNATCLLLYRLLHFMVEGSEQSGWVALDSHTGKELTRCKSMPEIIEAVLKLRIEEARTRKGVTDESL